MQFSEHWLRSLCNPPIDTEELSHRLTMAGLEVEECQPVAPAFNGVVVAEVLSVERHPNADRLALCQVDDGSGHVRSIVCGAPNVAVGIKVACARIGAQLPGETADKAFVIKLAKMRGVESQGMLCSARELGLSSDHEGLLLLNEALAVGTELREALSLDDNRFVIKLTPNRADCLSVLGVAREVAALTGTPLRTPDVTPVVATSDDKFSTRISDRKACPRFTSRVIRGVNAAAATPDWMRQRLERAGQRCISALVDVTNYVMLELGRPLHVYDLRKLRGVIDVRFGKTGEQLKLLNEQIVTVDESVLCIADDSGPIGLAGIMGGDSTKADLSTADILLESAFFLPEIIAGRAKRFGFSSDASHRFERGVDFDNNLAGIERATRLILDICGGEPGPVTDVVHDLPARSAVTMRVARARRVIGVAISSDEMIVIFDRLGMPARRSGSGEAECLSIDPPSWRFDLRIEEDLIEEIARVWGFERIPAKPPIAPAAMLPASELVRSLHDLRHTMAASEFREVINFSFVEARWESDFSREGPVLQLLNPIASQMSVMRSTLVGGLIANLRFNLNRKMSRVRVFEIGRVFWRDTAQSEEALAVKGIAQPVRIAALAFGPVVEEQWGLANRSVDFYDLKNDLEHLLAPNCPKQWGGGLRFDAFTSEHAHPALHPGRSARVILDGCDIGWIGELHPRHQAGYELPQAPVLFELDTEPLLRLSLAKHAEVSRFPAVMRDFAVVVPEQLAVQSMLDAMRAIGIDCLKSVSLFDLYRGKGVPDGCKSLAFRVIMQENQRTMTDQDADAVMASLLRVLSESFGASLRS